MAYRNGKEVPDVPISVMIEEVLERQKRIEKKLDILFKVAGVKLESLNDGRIE